MHLKWVKDLGQPLDSADGLKYLSIMWSIIGTNPAKSTQPIHWRILYYVYSGIINLFCGIFFPAGMWINLYFIDSYKDLVANLSLSCSVSISIIKQLVVLWHSHLLLKAVTFIKLLDERSNYHFQDRKHISKAVRYSKLYAFYFPLYIFCGWGIAYNGWNHHQLIFNAWYPNFFSNPERSYLAAFIFQLFSQIYVCLQSVFNDTYPSCYLILMIGHLESLAARITRIGWAKGEQNLEEQNIEELTNCIKDHKNLLSYFDCIRPVISITLFCQFLIAGFALCITAINLTFFAGDLNEQFFVLIYLIILLIQMFPCCWYVNAVMEKSNYLTTAMYSCNWMDQNLKFRKMLIIFMQRSQKINTIMAGNLAPVTLQTFLTILRFSFSMFTLITNM